MTAKQWKQILNLRDLSDGLHKCCFCQHIDYLCDAAPTDDFVICGTTFDENWCDLAGQDMYYDPDVKQIDTSPNGNIREYTNGLKTVDNGGGYWIIECPHFEELNISIPYSVYIKSRQWQEKRDARLRLDRYRCQMCGTAKNLNVHHITYERLGNEDMSDLVTLCQNCHEQAHKVDIAKKES